MRRMMKTVAKWAILAVLGAFRMVAESLVDLIAMAGLSALAVGLWWKDPALSLVVVGSILFFGGVWLARRRAARSETE